MFLVYRFCIFDLAPLKASPCNKSNRAASTRAVSLSVALSIYARFKLGPGSVALFCITPCPWGWGNPSQLPSRRGFPSRFGKEEEEEEEEER